MSDTQPPASDDGGLASLVDLVEIGRGGFATVFKARQPRFARTVAVKVLDPGADALSVERFERECEAMGMLSSHPNIVTIFDAGVNDDGKPFLIMEFMPDGTLDDRLDDEGPLAWDEVTGIGVKLAGALQTAHEATVLHRDVKPANVLCSTFGEPCLSDFGLARFGGQAKTTGVVTATLLHAPPEILAGQPATPQSDVYSLGSTLFTLLNGGAPFWQPTDESMLPLLARIADEPVPDLPGVPDALAAAIRTAMAKAPSDRPESAAAFGHLLQEVQTAAGLSPTMLPTAGQASVRAARAVASAPTDPNATISRGPATTDPNETIVRRPAPPTPTDGLEPKRKRWPVVLGVFGGILVVGALILGAIAVFGGGGDDGGSTIGTIDDPTASDDAGGTPTAAELTSQAADVAGEINQLREEAGMPALRPDLQLAREAKRYATASAEAGAFVDVDADAIASRETNRWFRVLANTTAGASTLEAYETSVDQDRLRANLLDESVDVVGVGVTVADDGTYFLVELLAQRV